MSITDTAAAVLECVGGLSNVYSSSLCATRLRIMLRDPSLVDRNALHSINGVLGIADRGSNGIEVVFGPNLVRNVFHAFAQLTGPTDKEDETVEAVHTRPVSNFQVKITPETPGAPRMQGYVPHPAEAPVPVEDDDTNALLGMLEDDTDALDASGVGDDTDTESEAPDELDLGPRLLVINGPNFNMLGVGNTKPFGEVTFASLLESCRRVAAEVGFVECVCYQSNHEGDLIDQVQDAYDFFDAIVINPGAHAHTSIALHDALEMVGIPAIEVHMTYASIQNEFRRHSYVGKACLKIIEGMGVDGYCEAITELARHLGIAKG